MAKVETLEEFLARGGRVQRVHASDKEPRRYAYSRTRHEVKPEERAAFVAERAKIRKAGVTDGAL